MAQANSDSTSCDSFLPEVTRSSDQTWHIAVCLTCGRVASSISDGGTAIFKLADLHEGSST